MASTQALTLKQVSQSVTDNTSQVRIQWTATQTGQSHNYYTLTAYYWVSVNGGTETKYTVSTTLPQYSTNTILDKTITVNHNDKGECTVRVRTSLDTGISAGVVTKSATLKLDTIPRKSTLSASNGTLNTSQTLTVTRKSTSFTHTITYKCGSASGTICTKSSSTSISWKPPLSLASQNKTGTSVSVTFTITTYSGSTSIGSNTKTITCSIPSSVKPSCTISVTDISDAARLFGVSVQGLARFKIVVTPTLAYGSPIKSYSITANGKTYRADEVITDVINSSGNLNITATVTDDRGRTSSTVSSTQTIAAYSKPTVTSLSVGRYKRDDDGNLVDDEKGTLVNVKFSGRSSDVNSRNSVKCVLKYKKTSESNYTEIEFPEYERVFNITDGSYTFDADSESAYDIVFTIADKLYSDHDITSVSTGFVIMDWKGSGRGIAFGKMAELDNVVDVNMDLRLRWNMQMGNNAVIRGTSTDGTVKSTFQPQNENGNTVIGYGNYDHQSGSTNVYGHDINFGVSNIANPGTFRPYRRQGDTITATIRTSGYVTNSGKDVSFWIPVSVPIVGAPAVTVTSVNGFVLRQGNKYTHGSTDDSYAIPVRYEAFATMFYGIHVKAIFEDTTNVINNDSIGVFWNGTITFS